MRSIVKRYLHPYNGDSVFTMDIMRQWTFCPDTNDNEEIGMRGKILSGRFCDHDVVGEVDQNLYYSKEHGKNRTSYCQNGRMRTTREEC